MYEKLDLKDFDLLGIIELEDVRGIEKYVTGLDKGDGKISYLSRSKEYYNVKTLTELAISREELRRYLNSQFSKRNFVILENMLNCSARSYFTTFQEYIRSGKNPNFIIQLEQTERCLMEDVGNMINLLEGKGTIKANLNNRLPGGNRNCEQRAIEMDNKAMLYAFTKILSMNNPEEVEILTPGYGSIYIGPFFKAMYNCNYTNIFKSKYIEELVPQTEVLMPLRDLMSSERPYEPNKKIVLIDDNIGTGTTMKEIKKKLAEENINNIFSGAVQYNWRNYYRVGIGEKEEIDRFEISEYDFITPLNYEGHKIYKMAIASLISSGEDYVKYLNSKNYRLKDAECDLLGILYRGLYCAREAGLILSDEKNVPNRILTTMGKIKPEYQLENDKLTNPFAQRTVSEIIKFIKEKCRDERSSEQLEQ